MLKIGFLGPKGTFSHEAVKEYVKDKSNYNIHDYNSIADVLMAVQKGEADEAIVPIENSLEGAINVTLDMIASDVDLKIKSEVIIPIRQNLLVKKGTKLEDIKHVLSIAPAIGQCIKYINTNLSHAEVKYVYSTSTAAEEVSKGQNNMGAIGSLIAAEIYDLEVLAEGIEDGSNNLTRFVVVSRDDNTRTGRDKTSIVFSTENKPGSLYRILDIFNLWDINMTRIESRPAKYQLGRYIFFIDILGHRDDDDLKDALTMIRKKTSFYKFLGSYPECEIHEVKNT